MEVEDRRKRPGLPVNWCNSALWIAHISKNEVLRIARPNTLVCIILSKLVNIYTGSSKSYKRGL